MTTGAITCGVNISITDIGTSIAAFCGAKKKKSREAYHRAFHARIVARENSMFSDIALKLNGKGFLARGAHLGHPRLVALRTCFAIVTFHGRKADGVTGDAWWFASLTISTLGDAAPGGTVDAGQCLFADAGQQQEGCGV